MLKDESANQSNHKPSLPRERRDYYSGSIRAERQPIDLPVGWELLDRFVIQKMLGRGQRGIVYLAKDAYRPEPVALKICDSGNTLHSEAIQEIHASSALEDYSHVLKVHEIFPWQWGARMFYVLSMEYAEEGSLRTWLHAGRQDVALRHSAGLFHLTGAAVGMANLQEVHRVPLDLKPENVLFAHGRAKLSDLESFANISDDEKSPAHNLLGTPEYMSPEQFLHGFRPDIRSSIYSFGIMLYEMLEPGARLPFQGSHETLCRLHQEAAYPPIQGLPPAITEILHRCLEKDPKHRYGAASDLVKALNRVQRPVAAKASRRQSGEKSSRDANALYAQARSACDAKNFSLAMDLCREILRTNPRHSQTRDLFCDLKKKFQETERLYRAIEINLNSSSLRESLQLTLAASSLFPGHPSSYSVLLRVRAKSQRYQDLLQKAWTALGRRSYALVYEILREALDIDPHNPELNAFYHQLGEILAAFRNYQNQIDTAYQKGDRHRAAILVESSKNLTRFLENEIQQLLLEQRS